MTAPDEHEDDEGTERSATSLPLTRRQALGTVGGLGAVVSSGLGFASSDADLDLFDGADALSPEDQRRNHRWTSTVDAVTGVGGYGDDPQPKRTHTTGTLKYLGGRWVPSGNPLDADDEGAGDASGCWKHTFQLFTQGVYLKREDYDPDEPKPWNWVLDTGDSGEAKSDSRLRVLALDEEDPLEDESDDDRVVHEDTCAGDATDRTVTADPVAISARRDSQLYGFLHSESLEETFRELGNPSAYFDRMAKGPWKHETVDVTRVRHELARKRERQENRDAIMGPLVELGLAAAARFVPGLGYVLLARDIVMLLDPFIPDFQKENVDPSVPDDRGFDNSIPEEATAYRGPIAGTFVTFDVRVAPGEVGQVRVESDHTHLDSTGGIGNPGWTLEFEAPAAPDDPESVSVSEAFHAEIVRAKGQDQSPDEPVNPTYSRRPIPVVSRPRDIPDTGEVTMDAYDSVRAQAPVDRYNWTLYERTRSERGFLVWEDVDSWTDTPEIDHEFTDEGHYRVDLQAIDDCDSSATVTHHVAVGDVDEPPTVSILEPDHETITPGEPVDLVGTAIDDEADPEDISYEWQLLEYDDEPPGGGVPPEDGVTVIGTGAERTHTFAEGGEFELRLVAATPDGPPGSARTEITVEDPGPTPQPDFSVDPSNPDPGETASFAATVDTTGTDRTVETYEWAFGDGETVGPTEATTAEHAYDEAGQFEATLTITDDVGREAAVSDVVTAGDPEGPTAIIEQLTDDPQPGESVEFSGLASSMPDGYVDGYEWDFDGDGAFGDGTGSGQDSWTWEEAGTYTIGLRVTGVYDGGGEATDTTTHQVEVGDDTAPTPVIEVRGAVTETDGGYEVEAGPEITFDAGASTDPNGTVEEFRWEFDDEVLTGETVRRTFADTRAFELTLEVTDDENDTGTATASITVVDDNVAPEPDFTVDPDSPRAEEPVTFDAAPTTDADGTVVEFEWDFGDGTAPVSVDVPATEHTYDAAGQYDVELRVTDDVGESASLSRLVTVGDPTRPTPDIELAYEHQPSGVEVTVDGTGSSMPDGEVTGWSWALDGDESFGDGTAIQYEFFDDPGTHDVTLVVTGEPHDGGRPRDSEPLTTEFTANKPPDAAAATSPNTPTAGQDQVTFDASGSSDDGTIVSYDWDFGDGHGASGETVTHTYDSSGSYGATLSVTDDFEKSTSITTTVSVNDPPTADADADTTTPLAGETVTLSGSNSSDADGYVASYEWGGGISGSGETIDRSFAADTSVKLTVTDEDGGTDTDWLSITPEQEPSADIDVSPTAPAVGDDVTVDGGGSTDTDGSIVGYSWSGDVSGSGETVTKTFTTPGEYTVTLTVEDDDGHTDTTTESFTVESGGLEASINVQGLSGPPYKVAEGERIDFDAHDSQGYIEDYAWSFPDGATATGPTASHEFDQPGSVTLTISNGIDDPDQDSVSIELWNGGGGPPRYRDGDLR